MRNHWSNMNMSNLVTVNGETNSEVTSEMKSINMVAISDHSCTASVNSKGNQTLTAYPNAFDHIYASSMAENDKSQGSLPDMKHIIAENRHLKVENKQLKELLLVHQDLTQQQSEQQITKDKLICTQKLEIEQLKQRLERMDRRVTLKKAHELSGLSRTNPPTNQSNYCSAPIVAESESSVIAPCISPPLCTSNLPCTSTPIANRPEPDLSDGSTGKRNCEPSDSNNSTHSSNGSKRNCRSSMITSVLSDLCTTRTRQNGKGSKKVIDSRKERSKKKRNKSNQDGVVEILTTDQPYETCVGELLPCWQGDQPLKNTLEVPSWREKKMVVCYTMEGTENLSDDVFDRRHGRLEVDERRRKRWDIQRIRELKQVEKLREKDRRMGKSRKSERMKEEEKVVSLWPLPEDAEFLEVSDMLPVTAFGCPLTKFIPTEFSLPWLTGDRRSRTRLRGSLATQRRKR